MARATRSSIHQDKQTSKQSDSKKRKRVSDFPDEPAQKLQRTDRNPYAATIPIHKDHAHKILHVLTMIDKQGLLNRVYPLDQSSTVYSLRTLLEKSQEHTLATLRSAVQNLLPISVHPRAPTPAPAAQQQRFCDIALSLLDQASFHPLSSLDIESILPPDEEPADEPSHPPVATANKRYALMQHLPSGDYWTSANLPLSPVSLPETGPAQLKDLPTGYADLVAVFPAPSLGPEASTSTLADLTRTSPDASKPRNGTGPSKRRITRGSFLDYGPYASFAPTWVQDGREVGMRQLGEVYAQKAQRMRERMQARLEMEREREQEQARALECKREQSGVVEEAKPSLDPDPGPAVGTNTDMDADAELDALQDILAPAEIDGLKAVLGNLQLENAVQELLTRNRRALQRLGTLQVERLRAGGGRVKEGDEEWDVANGILESLTLLASLRPRSSAHPAAPLIPPPTVLHTLQRTLPRAAAPGWYGTLPSAPGKPSTALRDDSTVKVRPGVPAIAPTPVVAPAPTHASTYGYYAQPQGGAYPTAQGGQYRYNSRPAAVGQYQPQPQQQIGYTYGQTQTGYGQQQTGYTQQQQQTQTPYGQQQTQQSQGQSYYPPYAGATGVSGASGTATGQYGYSSGTTGWYGTYGASAGAQTNANAGASGIVNVNINGASSSVYTPQASSTAYTPQASSVHTPQPVTSSYTPQPVTGTYTHQPAIGSYTASAVTSTPYTPSGGSTQQAATGAATPTYGSFFTGGSGASTPVGMGTGAGASLSAGGSGVKAVANTVLGKLSGLGGAGQWAYSAGTGSGATVGTPPVLPAHLRGSSGSASQPPP
ncbi:hypothetical protein C8R43DRAFT_26674 [Mycena crocata]|nr:hypothetical protein C8R43DRAFT_26674 [Mycena crocata]